MELKSQRFGKSKKKLVAILVVSIGLALAVAYYATVMILTTRNDSFNETVQTAENTQNPKDETVPEGEWIVAADKPRYMTIEKIGVHNARVIELGTTGADNQLEDPKNIHDVGWYKESALPGAPLDTKYAGLYDGHNTGINQSGVFYNLAKLSAGDKITLERGDGVLLTYIVNEVETPLLEEINMEKMQLSFKPDVEGLNIITCGGDWDVERQTYTHRVTVRSTLAQILENVSNS